MRRLHTVLFALALCLTAAGPTAAAAKPVTGSVSGPITSVKGNTFQLTTSLSPSGSSKVTVGSATLITEQVTGSRATVKAGTCVMATGQKSAKGVVTATRLTVSASVKGSCNTGFVRRANGPRPGGAPPTGTRRPPGGFGNFANFGFAFGTVTAVKGAHITVKGPRGATPVTLSAKTQITTTERVQTAAITAKSCAFVRGTSTDKGITVQATNVSLTKPTSRGCTFAFRGR